MPEQRASAVAILGPGGVGGLLAAVLDRAGVGTTVVGNESTIAVIADGGIRLRSVRFGEVHAHPRAVPSLDRPGGTLVVATKATALPGALHRIQAEPGLVVPLLNGLEHMALLRERFPDRVVAGSIRVQSERTAPGEIEQSSPGLRIELAREPAGMGGAVERFAEQLRAAGVPVEVLDSEAQVLWTKLARLGAIACVTSAYDSDMGRVRASAVASAELRSAVEEITAVARDEGVDIASEAVLAEIGALDPAQTSSMRRDVAAGQMPELDAIAGAIMRAGTRHGLACPTIAGLARRIAERAGIPAPPSYA